MNELRKQIEQATMRDRLPDMVTGTELLVFGAVFFLAPRLTPFSAVPFFLLIPVLNRLKTR